MPMYDYRCPEGHAFERLVPVSAGPSQDCPACGAVSPRTPPATGTPSPADRPTEPGG